MGLRELARRLDIPHPQLSYWESGTRIPKIENVTAILNAIGTTGPDRERILDLTRNALEKNWVSSDEPGMSMNLAGVLDCERTATKITTWIRDVIPGLLQVEDYARTIISTADGLRDDQIRSRVKIRMERREILVRTEPVEFVALIAESAIREVIGSPEIQVEQLKHVLKMAARPNVTVQVVQPGHGWHPGMAGPFVIFDFQNSPSIVYIEHFSSASFLFEDHDVEAHQTSARVVRGVAMSPTESEGLIASVIEELETTR